MHEEYIRIVPDADTAVLLIHGICGTPDHFRELIPLEARIPENWSVCNLLLDGHGGTVSDFAQTSGKKWEKQVQEAYKMLEEKHDHILIVGHSMGTLFALQLAAMHPEKVKKLFLLAVPLRPWLKPSMIVDLLQMVFGKPESLPAHRAALAKAAGIRTSRKLWQYIPWVPRFLDLFYEIRCTEGIISEVTPDCRCYQSQKDELVLRCSEKVLKQNERLQIIRLPNSTHFYYAPEDRVRILTDFEQWINETHD